MKIGEVEIGKNYGAVDEPSKRYWNTNPRKVEVVEIVTVEETYWTGGGFTNKQAKRNVRRVKVKMLDEETSTRSFYRNEVAAAAKDSEIVVEARNLVGLWADLSPGIHARIREEQADAEAKANTEASLRAAGFKNMLDAYDVRVHSRNGGKRIEVEFHGEKTVALLLTKLAAQQ